MARKRTGLRNRYRSGASTYALAGKASTRDTYGNYAAGKCLRSDNIAGRNMVAIDQEALKGK